MSHSDDDENELFRRAMAGVRRIEAGNRVAPPRRLPTPEALQQQLDDRAVLDELLDDPDPESLEHGETLQYRAPGVQDRVLRQLRRGHYRIERDLDLHGHNRELAKAAVGAFLRDAHAADIRCVRIVHGKGNGSPNSGPVLKSLIGSWLRRRKDVTAYCSARPVDGGTGAVYVLLRAG